MINLLVTYFITLVIGPIMFLVISRVFYKKERFLKYPVDSIDFIGDCVFLPFLNSLLVYFGVVNLINENSGYLWFCILFAVLVSFAWGFHRKNISSFNDWSRPKIRVVNFGGLYHFIFFIFQSFLIFVGILYLSDKILVWFAISGYLFTVIYHNFIEGPRSTKSV